MTPLFNYENHFVAKIFIQIISMENIEVNENLQKSPPFIEKDGSNNSTSKFKYLFNLF